MDTHLYSLTYVWSYKKETQKRRPPIGRPFRFRLNRQVTAKRQGGQDRHTKHEGDSGGHDQSISEFIHGGPGFQFKRHLYVVPEQCVRKS
jgi:hypothetical protein